MRTIYFRSGLMAVLGALWFTSTWAASMDTQEFYARLVSLLKDSQTAQVELLVRENREAAGNCLEIIRGKLTHEKDPQRIQAYRLVATELEELVAVTSDKRNCRMADNIYERALKIVGDHEAREVFSRVVRLCPDNLEGHLRVADLSKKLGEFDDAVSGYETVLRQRKDSPDALMGMGEALFAAGLYRRSAPYFKQVLAAYPENKTATRYLQSATKEIKRDREGIISTEEIVDRLWPQFGTRLMCMCPYQVALKSRLRLREVTFATESTHLDRKARSQLAILAKALRSGSLKDGHYLIEGHTDSIGTADYNQALSRARGEAVKRYLVRVHGIDPSKLSVAGMGESRPWTTNKTYRGRRRNRRIEVISIDRPVSSREQEERP